MAATNASWPKRWLLRWWTPRCAEASAAPAGTAGVGRRDHGTRGWQRDWRPERKGKMLGYWYYLHDFLNDTGPKILRLVEATWSDGNVKYWPNKNGNSHKKMEFNMIEAIKGLISDELVSKHEDWNNRTWDSLHFDYINNHRLEVEEHSEQLTMSNHSLVSKRSLPGKSVLDS